MLAASTGGHLEQLVRLAPQLKAADDSLWVTFDTPQSRSLLSGRDVLHVPYIAPRDAKAVLEAFRTIRAALKGRGANYVQAVSTGSALALAALPAARTQGIPARYIESVSRTQGPSLSGRILAASRMCDLETQHPGWASRRWQHRRSVLDSFRAVARNVPRNDLRLFVTLGTIKPYRFDAAVDAVLATGLAGDTTTWQLGCTDRDDLPGTSFATIPSRDFERLIKESDVVVTHSGVGSIMKILECGKYPIVLPRRKARGEHVDDHQSQIANLVCNRGIANAIEVGSLTAEMLHGAAKLKIVGE